MSRKAFFSSARFTPILFTALAFIGSSAKASLVYVTAQSNSLLQFDTATPGTVISTVAVTGLQTSEQLLGIDFRPATGMLYALGSTSRLYTVNTSTGLASQVGAAGAFSLSGTSFGFDFNPTVDRIRVTSNSGQNLRLNPIDGTLTAADGALAYATGDVNAGQTPGITASAYTRSFAGATTTTLYDIDTLRGLLVIQNPPNNGTLNTVGTLGIANLSAINGFDILPIAGTAYAALQTTGGSGLYTVNLTTGSATSVGSIGTNQSVTGLALVSDVPEPATWALLGLGISAIGLYHRRKNRGYSV